MAAAAFVFGRDELGAAGGREPLALDLDLGSAALARELGRVGACSVASASAAGVTADDPGRTGAPRARAAEAIAVARDRDTPGVASATSSAAAQPPSTSTNGANKPCEQPVERRVRRAHARRERGARPAAANGSTRCAVVRRRPRAAAPTVAALQALDRGARRGVAVDDDRLQRVAERGGDRDLGARRRSRAGRRAGRARRRARRRRRRRGVRRRARARASRRAARQRDASAVASRHAASACCTASSAARSARASSVSSGEIAASRVDLGAQRLRQPARARRRRRAPARSSRARRRPPRARPRTCARSRRSPRPGRRSGRRSRCASASSASARRRAGDRGRLAGAERTIVRGAQLDRRASAASTSARVGASESKSASTAAAARACAASATSDSTTPSSATDASSRSRLRPPFGDEVHEPAAAFAQRLGAREEVGDVVVARNRERVLGVEHLVVEGAQLHAHVLLLASRARGALSARRCSRSASWSISRPGEVQRDRVELGDDAVVAARRVGLALERPQLAPDLAQQVGEAQQVALGRLEPALGLLLALAELEDARGFLDDRPAVLGTRVEHRVELALADDHVLLAADARVGEQLLDVEQAARRAVDHVLRLTGAEQHAGDRDLGELDRQQAARCCRS